MCEQFADADRKLRRRGVAQVRFWESTELIEYVVPWLQSVREVSRLCRTCSAALAADWSAYCVAASRGECSAREWGRLSQRRLVSALARLTAAAEAEAGTSIESRGCVAAFVLGDCVRPRGSRGCYGLGGDGDAAMNAWLLCRGGAVGALACIFGSGGKSQSKVGQWSLREACGWAIGATMLGASAEDGAAVGAQSAIEAAELVWRLGVVRKSIDRLLQPSVGRGLRATCARLLGRFELAASLGRSLDRRRVGLLAGLDRPRGLEALLCYACDDQGEGSARSAASDALRRRASEASQATRADAAAAVVGRSSRLIAGHRFVSPAGVACLACLARALPNELASAGAVALLGDVLKAADNLVSLKPPSPKLTRKYEARRASHGKGNSAKRRCTTCRDPPPPSHRRRPSIATYISLPACVAADEHCLLEVVADAALGLARVARRSALRRAGLDRFGRAQLDLQAAVLDAVPPHTLVSFLRFADRSRGPPRLASASARAADMCAAALTNLAAGSHTNRARLLEAGVLDALRDAIKATPNTDAAPLRAALRAVKPPDSYVRLVAPLASPSHDPNRADLFYYDSDQDDDDDDDEDNYSSEASDEDDDDEDEDLEDDEEDEDDDDDDDELDDFNDLDEEDLDHADEGHFF